MSVSSKRRDRAVDRTRKVAKAAVAAAMPKPLIFEYLHAPVKSPTPAQTAYTARFTERVLRETLVSLGAVGIWSATFLRQDLVPSGPRTGRFLSAFEPNADGTIAVRTFIPDGVPYRWHSAIKPPVGVDAQEFCDKLVTVPVGGVNLRVNNKPPTEDVDGKSPTPPTDSSPSKYVSKRCAELAQSLPGIPAPTKAALADVADTVREFGLPEMPAHMGHGIFCGFYDLELRNIKIMVQSHRHLENRNLSNASIRRYGEDMRDNFWIVHHQGLAFGLDRQCMDGHNRLEAMFNYWQDGMVLTVPVWFRLPRDAQRGIDQQRVRSLGDTAMVWAYSMKYGGRAARAAIRGFSADAHVPGQVPTVDFVQKHEDAYAFVLKNFAVAIQQVRIAPVMGAVMRAYYHVRHDVLERFVARLYKSEGELASDGQMAARLKDWLEMERARRNKTSHQHKYANTIHAIELFAKGEAEKTCTPARTETYVLPEDPVKWIAKMEKTWLTE